MSLMAPVTMLPRLALQGKVGEKPHERLPRKTHLQAGKMIAMTPRTDGAAKQPMQDRTAVGYTKPSRDSQTPREPAPRNIPNGLQQRPMCNRGSSTSNTNREASLGRSGNRGAHLASSDESDKASASQTRRPPPQRLQRKSEVTSGFTSSTDTAVIESFLNHNCSNAVFSASLAATDKSAVPVVSQRRPSPRPAQERQRHRACNDDDGSGSEEEDFAALRRKAKDCPTAPIRRDRHPKVVIPERSSENSFCDPSPAVFSCDAGEKALRDAKEAAKRQSASSDNAELDDFILFFEMQGLGGPLRAYARGFVAQGVRDPCELAVVPEDGMKKMVMRAGLDAGDELILMEALMALR